MKVQYQNNKKESGRKNRGKVRTAGLLSLIAMTISILTPSAISFAQSISIIPTLGISSGQVERAVKQNRPLENHSEPLQLAEFWERTMAEPSSHSSIASKNRTAPVSSLNVKIAEKRVEGPTPAVLTSVRSRVMPPQITQSQARTAAQPKVIPANKPAALPSPVSTISIPKKLKILAQALMDQNIKGFAAQKLDEFMYGYIASIGVELDTWIADTEGEKYFQDIFKIEGPWILVFLAMSPTSMHEYMMDLDLPSTAGDILEAKRLPVNMTLYQKKQNLIVETQGAYDLWITFQIDEKNEVVIVES